MRFAGGGAGTWVGLPLFLYAALYTWKVFVLARRAKFSIPPVGALLLRTQGFLFHEHVMSIPPVGALLLRVDGFYSTNML